MQRDWQVEAGSDVELAVCRAPGGDGQHPPRLIGADKMPLETRGEGTNTRHVCNILPETEPADSLLVVEVITPAGNWSSYPRTSTIPITCPKNPISRKPIITA